MRKNRVLEKLRADEVVSVTNVGAVPMPWLVELVGNIGFDCIWFDMEHRCFSLPDLLSMTVACRATGMETMVRIVKDGYPSVMKPLECGATGIMIPHCKTAEEVKQYLSWAKYPPQGKRGFDNAGPDGEYLLTDLSRYIREANEETFFVAQIEDREAIEHLEEIVALEGVDIIFVGASDLSLSYGVFPDRRHSLIMKVVEKIAALTAESGKWWGMPFGTVEQGMELVAKGARFLSHGSDIRILGKGFREVKEIFSKLSPSQGGRNT
jgi:2-keto-3-deoxy-L-rhamnonate aldolase RhmA